MAASSTRKPGGASAAAGSVHRQPPSAATRGGPKLHRRRTWSEKPIAFPGGNPNSAEVARGRIGEETRVLERESEV